MMPVPANNIINSLSQKILIGVLYMVVAAVPITVGMFRPGLINYDRATLQDMIYGSAYRPFVKRQLVPLLVRAGKACIPASALHQFSDYLAKLKLLKMLKWPKAFAVEFLLALTIMYFSLIAFLLVLRHFLQIFFCMSHIKSHLFTLGMGLVLPVTFSGNMYVYDTTQLFLFTAGLVLLYKQYWILFYPVYLLACVNKETSLLLPVVFACWLGSRVLRPPNIWHFIIQLLTGGMICIFIAWIFRHNPGGDLSLFVQRNIKLNFSSLAWLRLCLLAVGIILSIWRIRTAPAFLSTGLMATLPVLLIAAFFFGYIDELRDYYEAMPFMICLSILTLGKRFGIELRNGLSDD
jgi:hypothetical protein